MAEVLTFPRSSPSSSSSSSPSSKSPSAEERIDEDNNREADVSNNGSNNGNHDSSSDSVGVSVGVRPVTVYFFDGPHDTSDHFLALVHYLPLLAPCFIYIGTVPIINYPTLLYPCTHLILLYFTSSTSSSHLLQLKRICIQHHVFFTHTC